MIRSIVVMFGVLVSFLFGCTASIQTPVAAPQQKQGMFLKNGDCNPKAEEATISLCKMGKKVEELQKKLEAKTAEPPAKLAAPPMPVEPPGFNHIPISTGVVCSTQAALTLEVVNSTEQFIEVEQIDGGMLASPCDQHLLMEIPVRQTNGLPRNAYVIPPGSHARYVAVVYTGRGVIQGRLGRKDVKINAYMPMGFGAGTDPAPRLYHTSYTFHFPMAHGGMWRQTIYPGTMTPG